MYVIVSRILDGNSLIGYGIYDSVENKGILVPLLNAIQVIGSGKVQVLNAEVKDRCLVGTNGSLDRLPTVDRQGRLTSKSIITIFNEVVDTKDVILGYDILDFKGAKARHLTADVIKLIRMGGISNGKLVEKDGTAPYISSIVGAYNKDVYIPKNKVVDKPKQVVEQPKQVIQKTVVEQPKHVVNTEEILKAKQLREEALKKIAESQKPKEEVIKAKAYEPSNESHTYTVPIKTNKLNRNACSYANIINNLRLSFVRQCEGKLKIEDEGKIASSYTAGNFKITFNDAAFVKQIRINRYVKVGGSDLVRGVVKKDAYGNREIDKTSDVYNRIIAEAREKYGNIQLPEQYSGLKVTPGFNQLVLNEMREVIAIIGIKIDMDKNCSIPKEKVDDIAKAVMAAANIA